MHILLCSIGTETRRGGIGHGLFWLQQLIQRRQPTDSFTWIPKSEIKKISKADGDVLLISLISMLAIPDLYRATKGRKPPIRTIIGGPGAYACGMIRQMCDAVILGRGEEAIFQALDHDYSGMAVPGPTMPENSVRIFKPTLLSPGFDMCGCGIKCGFCTYGWGNKFAVSHGTSSAQYLISKNQPSSELLLTHVSADMVARSIGRKRVVTGLDGICANDLHIVRKPLSWSRLTHWMQGIGSSLPRASRVHARMRVYNILNYPWHARLGYPPEEMVELQQLCVETRQYYPQNAQIRWDMGLQPFIPSLFPPMEREPVLLQDVRSRLRRRHAPMFGPVRGISIDVDPCSIPSLMPCITETLCSRSEDLGVLDAICNARCWQDLANQFTDLLGRITWRPQPWVRRINDAAYREYCYYRDLDRLYPGLVDRDFPRPSPCDPLKLSTPDVIPGEPLRDETQDDLQLALL